MACDHVSPCGWGVLILLFRLPLPAARSLLTKIDTTSFGPSQDQHGHCRLLPRPGDGPEGEGRLIAESAVRYEHLFGPQSDWVSGALQLSQYYAVAAQDLERRAEAHADAARTGRQQRRDR